VLRVSSNMQMSPSTRDSKWLPSWKTRLQKRWKICALHYSGNPVASSLYTRVCYQHDHGFKPSATRSSAALVYKVDRGITLLANTKWKVCKPFVFVDPLKQPQKQNMFDDLDQTFEGRNWSDLAFQGFFKTGFALNWK